MSDLTVTTLSTATTTVDSDACTVKLTFVFDGRASADEVNAELAGLFDSLSHHGAEEPDVIRGFSLSAPDLSPKNGRVSATVEALIAGNQPSQVWHWLEGTGLLTATDVTLTDWQLTWELSDAGRENAISIARQHIIPAAARNSAAYDSSLDGASVNRVPVSVEEVSVELAGVEVNRPDGVEDTPATKLNRTLHTPDKVTVSVTAKVTVKSVAA